MTNQQEHKLLKNMEDLAKSVKRIADALEPSVEIVTERADPDVASITWADAVRVLRYTCMEASECGPGCPMYEWCQANLSDERSPAVWTYPGAGE